MAKKPTASKKEVKVTASKPEVKEETKKKEEKTMAKEATTVALTEEQQQLAKLQADNQQLVAIINQMRANQENEKKQDTKSVTDLMETVQRLTQQIGEIDKGFQEVDKVLASTLEELENLPAPSSCAPAGPWDNGNWVAPLAVGAVSVAVIGGVIWYFMND